MGFPIDHLHFGTLNISIAPKEYETVQSIRTFRNISWHPKTSPEIFPTIVEFEFRREAFKKSLYTARTPDKPEHFQESTVLEVIAPWIENISYGVTMELAMPPSNRIELVASAECLGTFFENDHTYVRNLDISRTSDQWFLWLCNNHPSRQVPYWT